MKAYLAEVVSHFANGGLSENVTITVDACDFLLPREKAVGVGLFVNEALTNSAKHAFSGNQRGLLVVRLTQDTQGGWELTVEDDGVGFDAAQESATAKGTGSRLMQAFAQQADAKLTVESSSDGTRLRLASLESGGESPERAHRPAGAAPARGSRSTSRFRRKRGGDEALPFKSNGHQAPPAGGRPPAHREPADQRV